MAPTSPPPVPTGTIRTMLIANRGEIACRIIRTAREMGITTVAVFSDADDGAPHMREADHAVRLEGSSPADTYLRGDLVLSAARATGADSIHPGYGFLSENAAFARQCAEAGVRFVGPSPEAIDAMGSKIRAKAIMAAAGVPVLPGFTIDATMTDAALTTAAAEIGYPVLVKASFGGGGRGMRVVRSADELVDAVAGAQREATSAFGDGTVFVERFVEAPRHIEVQIFGDVHGDVVTLFERECSIQRRHQKVIEEAPSPAVTDEQRTGLFAAAVAAGEAIGYVGAGTVEFVMDAAGAFSFLEVNTRLQVEHPVTEMVTGLDLVRLQIEVSQGAALPTAIRSVAVDGHAIEARLYAEDVPAGFVPVSGRLHRLAIPTGDGIRIDSGYADGSSVSTFYDAMIAKVVAWAPTRAEAARRLADTLRRSEIHGVITNRDLLVATLTHPEFVAGRTDTAFFERNDHQVLGAGPTTSVHQLHAIAAAIAPLEAGVSPQPAGVPRGWRNVGTNRVRHAFRTAGGRDAGGTDIVVHVERARSDVRVAIDDDALVPVTVIDARPSAVEFELLGRRHRARLHTVVVPDASGATEHAHVYVDSSSGASDLIRVPRFTLPERHVAAGSLLAPMPGTVVAVRVAVGDLVRAGETLVAIEAMKMEHAVRTPIDGTVSEVRVDAGAQVTTGQVLVVVLGADDAGDAATE